MRLMRGRDLICRRRVAVVGVFTGYVLGINALRIILGESLNFENCCTFRSTT
jgi:hypothetical protein